MRSKVSAKKHRIMKVVLEHGLQIEPEALEELEKLESTVLDDVLEKILARVVERKGFIVRLDDFKPLLKPEEKENKKEAHVSVAVRPVSARDIEARVEVLFDPTEKLSGGASVEDFYRYFRSRFEKLKRILRRRMDVRGSIPISEVLKNREKSRVKFIGMVTEKTKRRGYRFQIEDLEASITVVVPENADRKVLDKAETVLQDQVICVSGVKLSSDLVVADDLIFPDVPEHRVQTSDEEVYATLISDIHVGSKFFMDKQFERFLRWLNGKEGAEPFRRLAGKVKYLLVCGDLVDGVGVYPGQERELAIDNLVQQYEHVARYFSMVPDHIEVIVIPGNHDASRQALPQPAIFRKYAEPLYGLDNVRVLGNPCLVSLHGVKTLMYHGRSLDDVLTNIHGLSFQEPDKAMELLLKVRHLAPMYGQRTAIAPEEEDYLVIEDLPAVFHSGHVHVARHRYYRGVLISNSGAWQEQTEYQKKNGLKPLPGVVPIVNLKTLQLLYIDFRRPSLEAMAEPPISYP
ncbi:MAG: DNA polymerase [Candidatus Bathyarchaeota archaeon B24]|nr:MAG: DNA polymerase [Candidatus Bathyarchaeota archaeon B24]RLI26562.1 MAG: DNA-directed DNA polymerase II small subunit [Candidatus Bathyarchaeota archaeon]